MDQSLLPYNPSEPMGVHKTRADKRLGLTKWNDGCRGKWSYERERRIVKAATRNKRTKSSGI
jgi:hypothetical protein